MLIFIDNFQFLSSSVDSLVKNLDKDNFNYFSQESDSKILLLVNQKRFYPHKYISDFEDIKMNWQIKKILVVRWQVKESHNKYEHVIEIWHKLEMETMKNKQDL